VLLPINEKDPSPDPLLDTVGSSKPAKGSSVPVRNPDLSGDDIATANILISFPLPDFGLFPSDLYFMFELLILTSGTLLPKLLVFVFMLIEILFKTK
jgi:hypothetical protein